MSSPQGVPGPVCVKRLFSSREIIRFASRLDRVVSSYSPTPESTSALGANTSVQDLTVQRSTTDHQIERGAKVRFRDNRNVSGVEVAEAAEASISICPLTLNG